MTDAEALRAEIRSLFTRFATDDLSRNRFDHALTERTVELCRAVVRERLGRGEQIQAEHHYVHAHLSMHRSILQEPEQEAVSVFATDRRLFYIRLRLVFGRPVSCDEQDGTTIDEIPYDRVAALRVHRKMRLSEVVAGGVIFGFALAFRSWLLITGILMQVLGILGILHGTLAPTRWVEIELPMGEPGGKAPLTVHAPRKKSARTLLRLLQSRVESPAPSR